MPDAIYLTAATLDGFLADDNDSLDWLFVVPDAGAANAATESAASAAGAIVMGANTYRWVYEHEYREHPERWAAFAAGRTVFVFAHSPVPRLEAEGGPIVLSGGVDEHWESISAAAGGRPVWIVGGGDLAGQFADEGLLSEVHISVAPATLGSGRPLLPRRLGPDRLRLRGVQQLGQFAELTYDVLPPVESA